MASQPTQAFTIDGGCSCRAVRYRIIVPALEDRIANPYKAAGSDAGDLRLPMFLICHCNGCRIASSGIVLAAIAADLSTVEASMGDTGHRDNGEPIWRPASEVFDKKRVLADTTSALAVYESSPLRSRWFCCRCGTPFGYSIDAEHPAYTEWKWPPMFDIYMGTVDRADLEHEWMQPERRLWCEPGVPWIRRMIAEGTDAKGLLSSPGPDITQTWAEP
ncbi:hypothetical protein LTR53_002266 [Teratosphaeriaceae sp. CCFEE 6253]|nr:hypothetical protein LTR53_002266 [Teratosphaeriaceae sp. CCFEE 6253]